MSYTESASEAHIWLKKFAGEWRSEIEHTTMPGEPNGHSTGSEKSAMIGDLWLVANWESSAKDGEQQEGGGSSMKSQLTVGFDPKADEGKGAFVGSFVCDKMTKLWTYEGPRIGNTIHLRTTTQSFTDPSKMTNMVDEYELIDDNHKVLTSKVQMEDGSWHAFSWAHYYRIQH
jgi:hypothetical protein